MHSMILPSVRDRWMGIDAKTYTPDYVENVVRGAMAGNLEAQWQMFDLMEATWPRLLKNLGEIKDAVVALDWQVQPYNRRGEQASPEATRRADLVEDLIWDMRPDPALDENDFSGTVRDLLDARGKGISVVEVDWESRVHDGAQVIAPRATRWTHPRYYGYDSGGTRDADRLMLNLDEIVRAGRVINTSGQRRVPFPEHKFLVGICKTRSGHPISGALLRTLGFWWAASNFTQGWFLNLCQIFGMPIRWATYDPNILPSDKTKLEEMLDGMGSSAWAMFPTGVQLELKEALKSGTDNPQMALLNHADKVCDILILRQTLTTDVGDSGSRALGDVHAGVLGGVKQSMADWVAGVLQGQFIRSICALNFGDTSDCPWLMPVLKAERDPLQTAQFLETASRVLSIPKAYAYETLGIPMPGPDDEVLRPSGLPTSPGGRPPLPGEDVEPVTAKAGDPEAVGAVITRAVARVADVRPRYLGPVQRELNRLILAAKSGQLSDIQLAEFLTASANRMPELFGQIDHGAFADELRVAMEEAIVRGVRDGVRR